MMEPCPSISWSTKPSIHS